MEASRPVGDVHARLLRTRVLVKYPVYALVLALLLFTTTPASVASVVVGLITFSGLDVGIAFEGGESTGVNAADEPNVNVAMFGKGDVRSRLPALRHRRLALASPRLHARRRPHRSRPQARWRRPPSTVFPDEAPLASADALISPVTVSFGASLTPRHTPRKS